MRSLVKSGVLAAVLGVAPSPLAPVAHATPAVESVTRFGLAAGFLVPTFLSVGGETISAEPGPLVLISFDRPVEPGSAFHYGGFLDVGSFSAGQSNEQVNLMQLGMLWQWERPETWGGTLRLGGRLGYRQLFADARGYDAVRGLAADLNAQWAIPVSRVLIGQIELGLLTEPIGGNGNGTVIFGPFPYLALGVVL